MKTLPPALAPLAEFKQFMLYRVDRVPGEPKPRKAPVHPYTLRNHDAHDPAAWVDAQTACNLATACGPDYGVAFTFTPDLGMFFLDIDSALQPDGSWSPIAQDLCAQFAGAAVEVSTSGTGLHIIGRGTPPPHGTRNGAYHLELYHERRFCALSGIGTTGDASTDHTAALHRIAPVLFPPRAGDSVAIDEWNSEPRADWRGPVDNDELLRRAMRSTSASAAFGNRASFADLWNADADKLGAAFPDAVRAYDASAADAALAQHLAFWTGCNHERIYDLMLDSDLARDKWEQRDDYLRQTIANACAMQTDVYREGGPTTAEREAQRAEARAIGETLEEPILPTVLTLPEMLQQLVYVEATREVAHRPSGRVRQWEAATGAYAASRHRYDDAQGKAHDVAALPYWRAHSERHSVDVVTWAPGKPDFCTPPEAMNGNRRGFNTWRGFRAHAAPANWSELVQPFTGHLAYLVPDAAQRDRFTQWLAHIVQRPEQLPHTCYLMVASETGIGRNWLGSILARVLRGYVALGVSLGPILDGKFNGRLSQKLLAVVDETREGMSENRHARGESLKRIVTEEYRLIDEKYGRQKVEFNACRWLMFSNHDDAVPFDNNDRRVIVIANPEQRQAPEYYAHIYAALDDAEFVASVWHLLSTLDLAGFNAGGHAPMSAAKQRSLSVMASGLDKAVQAFKDSWPGPVAGLSDLRSYVAEDTGDRPSEPALQHAMRRIGIAATGIRLRMANTRERPIGLAFSAAEVESMASHAISDHIMASRREFAAVPRPDPSRSIQ